LLRRGAVSRTTDQRQGRHAGANDRGKRY
jgi:hypothetical protein